MPKGPRAERYTGSENGRHGAKETAKAKQRRRERDANHDLVRRLRAGIRPWEGDDE